MNKLFQYVLIGSLAALICALGGGLWLIWQTLDESRELERQNRELQASLEASRIRVENFCEYPADVLCRVDERTGSVAVLMEAQLAPEADNAVSAPDVTESVENSSPANAVMTVQKVAKAQAGLAAQAEKPKAPTSRPEESLCPSVQEQPAPRAASAPAPVLPAVEAKPAKTADSPGAGKIQKAETALPPDMAPAKERKKEEEKPAKAAPVPAVSGTPMDAVLPSGKNAEAENSDIPVSQKTEAESPAPDQNYRHEVSGILQISSAKEQKKEPEQKTQDSEVSALPPVKSVPAAASEKPAESAVPAQDSPASKTSKTISDEVRKSWSRVEDDGGIFAFTITGSGPSLSASGQLLPSPWRYELTLDGLWEVQTHANVKNRLVKHMKVNKKGGKTVVTFMLKAKPYRCSLHRADARTVSVRIR